MMEWQQSRSNLAGRRFNGPAFAWDAALMEKDDVIKNYRKRHVL